MSESNQKKVIFLREGAESKMFTMWKSFHIEGYGMKELFLKNLSTDRD